jgi:hypothetical protein
MSGLRFVIRRATRLLSIALLVAALPTRDAGAQDTSGTSGLRPTPDSQQVVITLRDGSSLVGRVLEVTPTTVRFLSAVGESTIAREAIVSVRSAGAVGARRGEYWPEDPSRTRLFFSPTGRMLRKGEVYFADAYIFFPSVQGGVSDRFTLGGGMSLVPGLGLDEQVFYLTPKVGIVAGPKLNVAVGALVAGAGELSDEGPFGIGYGVATFGGEDANATIGAGFGFARSSTSQALLMAGGSIRTSRNFAFVTENYLYTGDGSAALISGGLRFMSGEKLAVDLAGFIVTDAEFPIPYLSFIYKF